MADPCKAEKVASRRDLKRYDLFKALTFTSLTAFTIVLVAFPTFAARVNFVEPVVDELRDLDGPELPGLPGGGDDAGRLVVRVIAYDEVELIGEPDEPERSYTVTVVDEDGETVAVERAGDEIPLAPGTYRVFVDGPAEIPPKLIEIEAGTLHDLVIGDRRLEALDPAGEPEGTVPPPPSPEPAPEPSPGAAPVELEIVSVEPSTEGAIDFVSASIADSGDGTQTIVIQLVSNTAGNIEVFPLADGSSWTPEGGEAVPVIDVGGGVPVDSQGEVSDVFFTFPATGATAGVLAARFADTDGVEATIMVTVREAP